LTSPSSAQGALAPPGSVRVPSRKRRFAGLALTWLLIDAYGIPPSRVALLEKRRQRWVGPRAAGTGDDSVRFLRSCFGAHAVDGALQKLLKPGFSWTWRDRAGDVLYTADWHKTGPSGFDIIAGMHQPDLEALAEERLRAAGADVLRFDHDLQDLQQDGDGVTLTFRHRADAEKRTSIRAKYVVGADSASSPVREFTRIVTDDLGAGFAYDWLVVDILPTPEGFAICDRHGYYQLCDPKRPLTCVWSGPKRRRFEFMRLPGEDKEELASLASAWRLLGDFGLTRARSSVLPRLGLEAYRTADTCEIERSAVYTFRARLAQTFRAGRCVLVGDAAHLTRALALTSLGDGLDLLSRSTVPRSRPSDGYAGCCQPRCAS
jgi:2-polyprenyl-6-methoxyphenol hydroxylase-like FAD-dependent oxidoreductase